MSAIVSGTLLVEVFVTLFVIMDPPGAVPIFLSLTSGLGRARQARSAWQATLVSFFVIVLFALFGQGILRYLNISMAALQCSGGLLLLLVALELLTGKSDPGANQETANRIGNVAMVPLGTPLLAGPGAIVATMVFVRQIDDFADGMAIALGIVGVHLVLWLVMHFSSVLTRLLRESGVLLLTRISGLLLSAIAVQMVADAVRTFITS